MAAINKVLVSETQSEGRLDAEYFHPKYNHLDELLHSISDKDKLVKLSSFVKKGIFDISPTKYRTEGVPLIRTTQIKTSISNENDLIFIDELEHQKNHSKTELLPGDIVFTKIGAGIGDVAVLNNNYPFYNFSQNVAGLSIRRENIDPYYLLANLISEIGREQILRYMMPSGQGKLELKDIKKILIPRFPDDEAKIADLVRNAERRIKDSLDLYSQATQLLDDALGLKSIEFKKEKSYTASFSEVVSNNRADADYYQTKYRQLAGHLESINTVRLGSISTITKGLEVGSAAYAESGPLFIRVSNLNREGFVQGNSDKYISQSLYISLKSYQPKIGDVLLTKDGTIGTCFVVDETIEGIISSGILNLSVTNTEIPKEYLALVINSKVCSMQASRDCSGALILHWKPEEIRKLRIPILSDHLMKQIAELAYNSKVARKESKLLLEQAKQQVETLIEQAAQTP